MYVELRVLMLFAVSMMFIDFKRMENKKNKTFKVTGNDTQFNG